MRVVLDTNVLLSGLMLPHSIPGKIVRAWRNAHFDLVLSGPLLEEIARALAYPKIRKRLGWSDEQIARFILMLRFMADIVSIKGVRTAAVSDPADRLVLATLIAGKAEYLVTGDKALLALQHAYPIVTPAEFAQSI
ncbi:MAG: putative toxin-antitoxin system toxin component, PIN family [Candidatus Melainabacteria bacterium]|nr:putative toxin-antitoxin system toxin component, PIN family [Candidatus Melainabacteria bacterium]